MALSVSVTVIGSRDCWQNECDIDPNILHIFDFCNPNVVAELTPTQVACLEDALCEPCADVTIDINGVPFDTVPSGGTLDIPVIDTGSNPVGSQIGTDWVIANNYTEINGVQVTDQEAEQNASIAVELDGNPSGTWNAGTQTWEVTSPPCADATVENSDVTFTQDIVSGGTYVLDDYEFEFQDASGTVIATEIRPAMIPETFNFATGLNFQYNLKINGVFSQVVNVTAGDDINININ
jgi:hypothetical protein